jgi:glycosyltransferase involved in cell wall biosynthesis
MEEMHMSQSDKQKFCAEYKGGFCPIVEMHVPHSWCLSVCKGIWQKGDPINPIGLEIPNEPPKPQPINPVIKTLQSSMQNNLGIRQYASELLGAAKRMITEKFAMVDDNEFIERLICCTTCGGIQRCPYCGCFLIVKDKLVSEKTCPNPQTYPQLKKYPPRNFWEVCGQKTTAIIIGRNEPEEWFNKSIEGLFATATGKLEVLAVLDGYEADIIKPKALWGEIKVIINNPAKGRRKGINEAVKRATGDYIFILDAHCRMSEGWDTRLKCACEENVIAVARIKAMSDDFETELPGDYGFVYLNPDCAEKWHPTKPPIGPPLIEPMMGFTGCAWMIRKADYERLGGYDESLGEWGYDGPEWALKIQLDADGKVVLRKDVICWHIFGTNSGAKNYLPKILTVQKFKNTMVSKYHDRIGWLAAQFAPLPEWDNKSIIYGSGGPTIICCLSGLGEQSVIKTCTEHLKNIPIDKRIMFVNRQNNQSPCLRTYYEQLFTGMESIPDARYIYIAEHDVLYHDSHFAFRPPRDDTFYYDLNIIWLTRRGYIKESPGQVFSTLVANRELFIEWLKYRIKHIDSGGKIDRVEPTMGDFIVDWSRTYPQKLTGTRQRRQPSPIIKPRGPKFYVEDYRAEQPSVDIRHTGNWTGDRTGEYFEKLIPWGHYKDLWQELLGESTISMNWVTDKAAL